MQTIKKLERRAEQQHEHKVRQPQNWFTTDNYGYHDDSDHVYASHIHSDKDELRITGGQKQHNVNYNKNHFDKAMFDGPMSAYNGLKFDQAMLI